MIVRARLIVRFGGDEFLCGLADVTTANAAERFSLVNVDLAETQQASVTVGVAELEADDALGDLIARADPSSKSAVLARLRSAALADTVPSVNRWDGEPGHRGMAVP
ncbi:MAG: hypothetical protein ACLP0J_13860 [Solirubrobacteraceae bacterium]|jgi:GGDEF domain-containing protein